MTSDVQHKETHLLEILISGLDARESAKSAASPMLLYLAEMIVLRAREELGSLGGTSGMTQAEPREGDATA